MKKFLHGADYNPEQWLRYPGIIDEDFRLLKLAEMNAITLGVFSWAALEPEESSYTFEWMDDIFARAERNQIQVILATPSGGKPNWLAHRYPEVRRVAQNGMRDPQKARHNHCLTSPVYREKVRTINAKLAQRYGQSPALTMWHLSNEYGGYCYCENCKAAFRDWLRAKYESLEALNEAYWARFWSHTYTSWEQIDYIDDSVNGMVLDWRRFMTAQCRSFIDNEAKPLRALTPGIPITTNLMGYADAYNYSDLAESLDIVSWDSYPTWHAGTDAAAERRTVLTTAFCHDYFRGLKGGKPFILMETTPSQVNWMNVSPLRRPGVHRLSAMQAVAHGADGICYFQFRKSRGSSEQHHGAVVDHVGHEQTRVFRDVAALGGSLKKLAGVVGARTEAKVALVFDYENGWALQSAASPQNESKNYIDTALEFYRPFWERGVAVDVISSTASVAPYDLVIAPMLYLLRPDQSSQLTDFVARGGTLVCSYQTGLVESTGLCIQGGVPGPLKEVLGLWVEEFDALPKGSLRRVLPSGKAEHNLSGIYQAREYCDLIHCQTAEVLATYGDDFYAGRPALTVNRFAKGFAYYIASRNDERFQDDFLESLIRKLALPQAIMNKPPQGVTAQVRQVDGKRYLFLLNFLNQVVDIQLDSLIYSCAETGEEVRGTLVLEPYGSRVLLSPA